MAIEVGLTTGSIKTSLTTDYALYTVFGATSSGSNYVLDLKNDRWYVLEDSSGEYIAYGATGVSPYDNLPNSYYIQKFIAGVEGLLDSTAISYGYNSIDNAISYYNSDIVASREDAIKFKTWRDNTLSLMHDNINNFEANGVTLPNLAGFTSQPEYLEFTAIEPQNLFFGDENFGYKRFEDNTFIGWVNVQHNSQNSGLGQNIPLPNGEHVKNIYSINGIVDQGNLTSDWLSLDYTLKIKLNGSNIHNSPTNLDYKVQAINGVENVYEGLVLRFNIFGSF